MNNKSDVQSKDNLRKKVSHKIYEEEAEKEEFLRLLEKSKKGLLKHLFEDTELREQATVTMNELKVQLSLPLTTENISYLFKMGEDYFRRHRESALFYYKHDRVCMEFPNFLNMKRMYGVTKFLSFFVIFFLPIFLRSEVASAVELML